MTRRIGYRLAGALAFLLLAGCAGSAGGAGDGTGGGTGDGTATITIASTPVADAAWLAIGMEKGFFADEGITIERQYGQGGAATLPGVLRGDYDMATGNLTSLVIARSQGLPVKVITPGSFGGTGSEDAPDAVLVAADSPIDEPADLAGKTVAVNTLQNIGPLTVNAALEAEEVDHRNVTYVEVPFPEMLVALEGGDVDAAWVVEPFVTQGTDAGARPVLRPYEGTADSFPITGTFTSESFLADNPDLVARFVRAASRSLDYSQSHPDEVRATIPRFTEIGPELAAEITLPTWSADFDTDKLRQLIDLTAKYGFIDTKPTVSDLLAQVPAQ